MSTARKIARDGRLRLVVAGAVVLTALATATATASAPLAETPARRTTQLPVFVLDKGRFTTFDAPGRGANEFQRINNRGEVVGSYVKEPGPGVGGYVRDRRGRFTEIAMPGMASTTPLDNNDRGEVVGNVQAQVGGPLRGFRRDRRGRYTAITVPGAVTTQAYGINNRGQVVGDYYRADGVPHGYLWDKGRFRTIDGPVGTGATVTNLNDRGQLIGLYAPTGDPSVLHGFLLHRGRYTTFDPDDKALTLPLGINNRGDIAGYTAVRFEATQDVDAHGFVLRRGPGGRLTRIDVPGALGTGAMGINDRGQVVGLYINPDAMPDAPMARMT
jgi:probable HAF family extracellular repeat protein